MRSTGKYFTWIICMTSLVLPMFSLQLEEGKERLVTEVFRVNSTRSGDYSLAWECRGVGLRCSVQDQDKILPNGCTFRYRDHSLQY